MRSLTIILITFLFFNEIEAQGIKFYAEKNIDEPYSRYGFIYKANRKTRKTGTYFGYNISQKKFNAIELRVNGSLYHDRKNFKINPKDIRENKGHVYISYKNPKFSDVTYYDTLNYNFPKYVKINNEQLNVFGKEELSIDVRYSNEEIKPYRGEALNQFLRMYGYSIETNSARFEINFKDGANSVIIDGLPYLGGRKISVINLVGNTSDNPTQITEYAKLNIHTDGYSDNHSLTLKYGGTLNIDVSGNDGGQTSSYGKNGGHGKNVTLFVEEYNDSLYLVSVSFGKTNKKYLLNPLTSEVEINTSGGRGGNGAEGDDGDDARNYNTFVDHERNRNLGEAGEDGYSGGDGGDGGDVTIHYPISFKPYLDIFTVFNNEGINGEGGSGGKGGLHQKLTSQKGKVFDALFPDRADCGRDGRDGRMGRSGKVDYVLTE